MYKKNKHTYKYTTYIVQIIRYLSQNLSNFGFFKKSK